MFIADQGIEKGYVLIKYGKIVAIATDELVMLITMI